MCALCGVLTDGPHWTEAGTDAGRSDEAPTGRERHLERTRRLALLNRVLGAYGCTADDWAGAQVHGAPAERRRDRDGGRPAHALGRRREPGRVRTRSARPRPGRSAGGHSCRRGPRGPAAGVGAMATYARLTPVIVVTGFLGSGKTTLLNHMLRHPSLADAAVLVNEFGAVGLDHFLVEAMDENTVLLESGCLCCTIRGDLKDSIIDLNSRRARGEIPPYRRLIVETTGLADPAPILFTLSADTVLKHHYRLGSVITTVDGVNGLRQLKRHPESVKQATVADRIVLDQAGHRRRRHPRPAAREAHATQPLGRPDHRRERRGRCAARVAGRCLRCPDQGRRGAPLARRRSGEGRGGRPRPRARPRCLAPRRAHPLLHAELRGRAGPGPPSASG